MAEITDVKLTDNSKEILEAMKEQVAVALAAIGQEAEGYAQLDCPVDTGRLKNSISNAVDGDAVYIGTNVEYAPEVEFNDHIKHKVGKAHFLRDAAANHGDHYEAILKAALEQ